jgi:hypothetical protein
VKFPVSAIQSDGAREVTRSCEAAAASLSKVCLEVHVGIAPVSAMRRLAPKAACGEVAVRGPAGIGTA